MLGDSSAGFEEAVNTARQSDVAVVFVGPVFAYRSCPSPACSADLSVPVSFPPSSAKRPGR